MDVNSLPKTVTRQRRGCDLNPGPSAPESSMLTTRLQSQPKTQHSINTEIDNSNDAEMNTSTIKICGDSMTSTI